MLSYAAIFLGALLLTFAFTPAARRLAVACGAIDHPGERKVHTDPIPRLGGAAVLAAVAVVVVVALWLNPVLAPAIAGGLGALRWAVLAAAALLIVLIGGIDDVRDLPARFKFVVEIFAAAAVVAVAGAPRAIDLSPFAGPIPLGPAGPVLGVFWIVALTNALNMTDGVDGVAAGLGSIAAAVLGLMSLTLGHVVAPAVLLALSGALIGFLPHNFRRAPMFLGDSGSLGAGFVLGSASLVGLDHGGVWLAVPALLALAVPLAELGFTVLRRTLRALTVVHAVLPSERFVLRHRNPGWFVADKGHIPHRLVQLGLGKPATLAILYLTGAALGGLALAAVRWPALGPFAGLVAVAGLVYFAPRWLYAELRVLERGALLPLFESRLVRSRPVQAVYDAVAVAVSYVLSEWLVVGPAAFTGGGAIWLRAALATAAALFGFWVAGLYRGAYRHAGIAEALRAGQSAVLGVVLSAGVLVAVFAHPLQLSVWLLALFFVLGAVVGGRLSFRVLDYLHQRGQSAGRRVLIFGAGRAGGLAVREILSNPWLGLMPVGFVDDDRRKWGREFQGFTVHPAAELEALLQRERVDELIISTRKLPPDRLQALADVCHGRGVRIVNFDLRWSEVGSEGLDREPGSPWPVPAVWAEAAPPGPAGTPGEILLDANRSSEDGQWTQP